MALDVGEPLTPPSEYPSDGPTYQPPVSSSKLPLATTALSQARAPTFFQNLTSFGVGYFTVDARRGSGFYDTAYLDSLPAEYEDNHIRIVRFDSPLAIAINGRSGRGTVQKPEIKTDSTDIE